MRWAGAVAVVWVAGCSSGPESEPMNREQYLEWRKEALSKSEDKVMSFAEVLNAEGKLEGRTVRFSALWRGIQNEPVTDVDPVMSRTVKVVDLGDPKGGERAGEAILDGDDYGADRGLWDGLASDGPSKVRIAAYMYGPSDDPQRPWLGRILSVELE